jgi:hypothetical protein
VTYVYHSTAHEKMQSVLIRCLSVTNRNGVSMCYVFYRFAFHGKRQCDVSRLLHVVKAVLSCFDNWCASGLLHVLQTILLFLTRKRNANSPRLERYTDGSALSVISSD